MAVGLAFGLLLAGGASALQMTDFAIFAHNKVSLGTNASVYGGPVGSNDEVIVSGGSDIIFSLLGGGLLSGGTNIDVGGNIVFNGNVTISGGSTINFVLADRLQGGPPGGVIPQPATLALLGLGLLGLAGRRLRARK